MKYIGIDIGGTEIKCGIVDEKEGIIYKDSSPTFASKPYKVVLERIVDLVNKVIQDSGVLKDSIRAIGIGIPGIETTEGLSYAKNLFWDGVEFRKDLSEIMEMPVYIDNDAHAAALAEMGFGSLIGCSQAIMLTLGTGVGGAVIVDGKIISGFMRAGGELGHITFVAGGDMCTCGRRGCFERYAAAPALIRIGKEYSEKYPDSLLHTAENGLENITARTVIDCARLDDEAASRAYEDYCEYLTDGIISFINMLNPQKICLGGGVANAGDFLFEKIREKCAERYFSPLHEKTEIVPAVLKNDAGILGAAMVAINELI